MQYTEIKQITAQDTYPVRHAVLRQGEPLSSCFFDGDNDQTTLHFGLFINNNLAGICSVYQRAPHTTNDKKQTQVANTINHNFQIRGMAVLEQYRNQSLGQRLLQHVIRFIYQHDPKATLWCNARLAAYRLYLREGFIIEGGAFDIPSVGPHYLMKKPSPSSSD